MWWQSPSAKARRLMRMHLRDKTRVNKQAGDLQNCRGWTISQREFADKSRS